MAFRVIFLSLLGSGGCVLGLSLAQREGVGSLLDPTNSGTILNSGGGDSSIDIPVVPGGSGQTMTGLDSQQVGALGLGFVGVDSLLLSGNSDTVLVSGNGSGDINSGGSVPGTGQILSDPIFHLILSEVYYDGTDEWIEITNIGGGNFSGNFTLVGVKSTPLSLPNISLLSGESKIFGDNLSQVSGNRFIGKTGLAFNIIDTTAIDIQILISGQVVDSLPVDQTQVNTYNDKKTSFERSEGTVIPMQTGRVANAQSGYIINPGVYGSITGHSEIILPPSEESGGNMLLPISCDSILQSDLIKINEIFPGNEKYPPYIELAIHQDIFAARVSISGDLVSGGGEFLLGTGGRVLEKNTVVLLAATGFWESEHLPSIQNSDFSLVSTGNRLLITIGSGQNGQVMDIVYRSGNMVGGSYYFSGRSHQCARILDAVDDFSPGFEQRFLKYFSGTTATKIEYLYTGGENSSTTGSCQVTESGALISGDIQVVITGSFIPTSYTIRIVNIEYDPEGSDTNNEKITLLANTLSGDESPLDLSKIFRLKVNGTNKTLPWMLPMNVPTTFTKTFGFPNSTDDDQPVVVSLTYGDYIFATYTYNPNIVVIPEKKEEPLTGEIITTGALIDISGLQFIITYVLPNPVGSDKFEELGLVINRNKGLGERGEEIYTGEKILVPGNTFSIPENLDLNQGFSLRVGKGKKNIRGIVHRGQENILSGSLGLVNKAACVSLFYQEEELTKFCYRTPKEGEKIYASDQGLQETTQQNLDILNVLQLKRIANSLCIWYKDASFLCKRIPASKAEIKATQEQKLYKGFASLVKQYIINNRKILYYETTLKEYFDRVAADKKLISQGVSQVDIYGQMVPVIDVKQQVQVAQTTLPAIMALFIGEEELGMRK